MTCTLLLALCGCNVKDRTCHDGLECAVQERAGLEAQGWSAMNADTGNGSAVGALNGRSADQQDASPPRRKRQRHDTPDMSPPRKQRHDSPDASPPRQEQHDSPDASPPRRQCHDIPDAFPA